MRKLCETCGAPIVREPGESIANHKRRVTCRIKACQQPHHLKSTRRSNERKKKRLELLGKEKRKRPYRGTNAMDSFLRGKREEKTDDTAR